MAIENTVSSDFYRGSPIVKSVFDCHLSSVRCVNERIKLNKDHNNYIFIQAVDSCSQLLFDLPVIMGTV